MITILLLSAVLALVVAFRLVLTLRRNAASSARKVAAVASLVRVTKPKRKSVPYSYLDSALKGQSWFEITRILVGKVRKNTFHVRDLYKYAPVLERRYPDNKDVCGKVRQQIRKMSKGAGLVRVGHGWYSKTGN